jgi:hypothetical protein
MNKGWIGLMKIPFCGDLPKSQLYTELMLDGQDDAQTWEVMRLNYLR